MCNVVGRRKLYSLGNISPQLPKPSFLSLSFKLVNPLSLTSVQEYLLSNLDAFLDSSHWTELVAELAWLFIVANIWLLFDIECRGPSHLYCFLLKQERYGAA